MEPFSWLNKICRFCSTEEKIHKGKHLGKRIEDRYWVGTMGEIGLSTYPKRQMAVRGRSSRIGVLEHDSGLLLRRSRARRDRYVDDFGTKSCRLFYRPDHADRRDGHIHMDGSILSTT